MALEFDSTSFSNFLPDSLAAEWYTDLYIPHANLDLFAFEDAPPFQNASEPPLPSPSLTNELYYDFFGTLLEIPSTQATKHDSYTSSPAAPGTAAESWTTGGEHSSVVVPTIPPSNPSLPLGTTSQVGWIKVPQKNYDHGRKQWNYKPVEPIFFSTNGYPGINLRDALRKEFGGLDGRDDPMLQDFAGAISCRLLFPGYPDNGRSCQIHALNWTRNRLPIPRSKLAHEVAKKLERYLNHMARVTPDESIEDWWKIGRGFMHIDNMFLVSLVSVSKGSFQPEIWVADPSVPHSRADGK